MGLHAQVIEAKDIVDNPQSVKGIRAHIIMLRDQTLKGNFHNSLKAWHLFMSVGYELDRWNVTTIPGIPGIILYSTMKRKPKQP